MDKDTQLPAEVTDEIWEKAKAYAKSHGRKEIGYYSLNWQAGATEYAIKLQEAKALLQEFVIRYEGGISKITPEVYLYNRIKTFLDGTK